MNASLHDESKVYDIFDPEDSSFISILWREWTSLGKVNERKYSKRWIFKDQIRCSNALFKHGKVFARSSIESKALRKIYITITKNHQKKIGFYGNGLQGKAFRKILLNYAIVSLNFNVVLFRP